MTDKFKGTVQRLCEASRKQFANPYDTIEWPDKVDPDAWYMSPELISLYGGEAFAALSEPARKRLSFFETVNFFSLNIHGEKPLVEGLARRLYTSDIPEVSQYLHHFLDEENKHMVYFGGFCQRYANKVYADKKLVFPREYAAGEEELLFFAKVMIFEEIVDVYNLRMAEDERLAPIARRINLLHHRDEARHLVFGREVVARLSGRYLPEWSEATRQGVREYLAQYLTATWKEYYNPDAYQDAGLPNVYALQRSAWDAPQAQAHRLAVSQPCLNFLRKHHLLVDGKGI